jgi:predicted nucleic-acid-binding Zn-ribbon protein
MRIDHTYSPPENNQNEFIEFKIYCPNCGFTEIDSLKLSDYIFIRKHFENMACKKCGG